ncbi:MAG TPA: M48 family peptidase, partial [Candidatus Methanoperedenaceae archaeon]|nr:M48 family peptidase [Candidatus Methanoperedenaceae archaeon]
SEAIIHELLHLKYPNRGKMFKTLVDAYLRKGTVAEEDEL